MKQQKNRFTFFFPQQKTFQTLRSQTNLSELFLKEMKF